ncbi:hypothetical protein K8R33_04940 [archaeon]|nr:hypothetical protein [archaeon]
MQKRGQVTVFIVVGIVILIVFALLFFLRSTITESSFEDEMNALTVPKQLEPVKIYLDSCLKQTVEEGVFILGEQGGYINLPEDIAQRSTLNPFSNTLEIYKGAEVAYWYYETANGIEIQNIPTKEKIELEIEAYVNENFADCFYKMPIFEEQGFTIQTPHEVDTEITINKNEIQVKMLSEVYVSLKDVSKNIDTHIVVLDSKLGELYGLAIKIMEEENENKFLEEKTIDMMVVYDEIPFSETEFTCERKVWQKSQVVEDMKEIVSKNIAAIRLDEISSSAYIQDPYNYFKLDIQKPAHISEHFQYFTSWPMQVEVSPTKGDLLVGDPITQSVPEVSKFLNMFFCLNNYHFVYDIKYPVLITLSAEGTTFQFANMVKIDNNQPRTFEGEMVNYEGTTEFSKNFCENAVIPIEVAVYDYETLIPVKDTSITYKCFSTICYIGETDSQGKLIANFPPCLNGAIFAQKQGYEIAGEHLSTNSQDSVSVLIEKHHTLDLDIKIINLDDGTPATIKNKQAVVQFENQENGYITMVTQEDSAIKLTWGNYKITSYLLSEEGVDIEIKTDTFTQCVKVPKAGVFGLFFKEEKCFETELEGDKLTDAIVGGAVFEWQINPSNKNKLTVYVPYDQTPNTHTEMIEIYNNIQTNHENMNFRYPELE